LSLNCSADFYGKSSSALGKEFSGKFNLRINPKSPQ